MRLRRKVFRHFTKGWSQAKMEMFSQFDQFYIYEKSFNQNFLICYAPELLDTGWFFEKFCSGIRIAKSSLWGLDVLAPLGRVTSGEMSEHRSALPRTSAGRVSAVHMHGLHPCLDPKPFDVEGFSEFSQFHIIRMIGWQNCSTEAYCRCRRERSLFTWDWKKTFIAHADRTNLRKKHINANARERCWTAKGYT